MLELAPNVSLPIDPAAGLTFAIVGKKRAGKTYTALRLAEQLLAADVCTVIIDVVGVCHGLRTSADGKRPGFPILIVGGEHGELPLADGDGAALARFVIEKRHSMILSVASLPSAEAERRVVGDFCKALFRLKEKQQDRGLIHVIMDEADTFAPQDKTGKEMECLGAVSRMVKQGGARGIGFTAITQRPSVLNKNVLTQLDVLIAHQLISPQDRKAVKDWIGANADAEQEREVMGSLAGLRKGEAWFWSPAPEMPLFERSKTNPRETLDTSSTPKAGESRPTAGVVAKVDLESLKGELGQMIERARAEDPKVLRERIETLEEQLADKRGVDVTDDLASAQAERDQLRTHCSELERAVEASSQHLARVLDQRHLAQGVIAELKRIVANYDTQNEHEAPEEMEARRDEVVASNGEYELTAPRAPRGGSGAPGSAAPVVHNPFIRRESAPKAVRPDRNCAPDDTAAGTITGAQQRILDALAWFSRMKVGEPRKASVGLLAKINPGGGYFRAAVGPLSKGGLVEYPAAGLIALTEAGKKAARWPDRSLTLRDYHEAVLAVDFENGRTTEMLRAIIRNGNRPISARALGESIGIDVEGGYFRASVGPLATLGVIKRANGQITPTAMLFPEGLR